MHSTVFRVVLDANVLFPFTLRDTLLRAAAAGLYQAYWTEEILDEATRNLISTGRMNQRQSAHLMAAIRRAFPESIIQGHEYLIPQMPNDEKDRHVCAAAVKAGAELIVTSNLKDFRHLPDGIEAQGPDVFLQGLLDLSPDTIIAILRQQASALKRPPITFEQLLGALAKTAPRFINQVKVILEERT